MRWMGPSMPMWLAPAAAVAGEKDAGESAITILLVLGLAAVIIGLGSLGDLRGKHMLPPRPRRSRRKEPDPPASRPKAH